MMPKDFLSFAIGSIEVSPPPWGILKNAKTLIETPKASYPIAEPWSC
jgi:hypothetical protein